MTSPSSRARAAWRARVDEELRGEDFERALVRRTLDGIALQPVYGAPVDAPADGEPGEAPYRRGSRPATGETRPWQLVARVDARAPEQANAEALAELAGAADGLWLAADLRTRRGGCAPSGEAAEADGDPWARGVDLGGARAVARLLDGVQTEILALHLDAGASAVAVAEEVLASCAARGVAGRGRLHCGVDPLGTLAALGVLPVPLDEAWEQGFALHARAAEHAGVRVFRVDGLPAHGAGAGEATEVGVMLAGLAELLRAAERHGAGLAEVAARTDLRTGVANEVFLEIAKLRALRVGWTRVLEACGVDAPPPFVHAVSSPRTLTRRDPWGNLLRATTQGFAAAVGGADAITLLPCDAALQRPGRFARRQARNAQHVLAEESHLGAIRDPAGGSFALEDWTDRLFEAGWRVFQEIEDAGGLTQALADGSVQRRLAEQRAARARAIATRRTPIVGVSVYATRDERRPSAGADAGADAGSRLAEADAVTNGRAGARTAGARAEPLMLQRDAAPFEALRDAADAWAERHGAPPRVALATLGPLAEHHARAQFARDLFAAGGFEAVDGEGAAAWRGTDAVAACVCGSDDAYAEHGAETVRALRAAGAPRVLLAGRPGALPGDAGAALQEAGLDGAIHVGCDALAVLGALHETLAARAASGGAR